MWGCLYATALPTIPAVVLQLPPFIEVCAYCKTTYPYVKSSQLLARKKHWRKTRLSSKRNLAQSMDRPTQQFASFYRLHHETTWWVGQLKDCASQHDGLVAKLAASQVLIGSVLGIVAEVQGTLSGDFCSTRKRQV